MRKEAEMAKDDFYCRNWLVKRVKGPAAAKAFPVDSTLTIGRQHGRRFMMAWFDDEHFLHVVTGLFLDENGDLVAPPLGAEDLASGLTWIVQVRALEELQQIEADFMPAGKHTGEGAIENNLSGSWGAEAPPPPGPGGTGSV
jgi:hypothetical protein